MNATQATRGLPRVACVADIVEPSGQTAAAKDVFFSIIPSLLFHLA